MSQNLRTSIEENLAKLTDLLKNSEIVVLRLNHRPRDFRVTTHTCLTARALGANGVIIADTEAKEIMEKINSLNTAWGGGFWVRDSVAAERVINAWRSLGGVIINLSMYGEDLRNVLSELYFLRHVRRKPFLVMVGSSKVPAKMYTLADYNISITNQPHSEVAALAIFLDKIHGGNWPRYTEGTVRMNPSLKGKGGISITGTVGSDEET
ncbi:MAG TPA: tRNA (cytidine(56)-2'-O)-methyltransferase [bacterium]|nr:tRNA (cytidine(56)-2'-O)-methyltransferase [bacterium]